MKQVATIVIVFGLFTSCRQKEVWVAPIIAPITEAVFCSGHIEPVQQVVLTSVSEGYLQRVHVTEGDVVEPGKELFLLDHQTSAVDESAARENLRIAAANASPESPILARLYHELSTARQRRYTDSVQYERLSELALTQSVSGADLDNIRLQFVADIGNVNSIIENIRATTLSLEQAHIAARAQYENVATVNRYYSLDVARQSRVYAIFKKEGELVRRGEAVALLGHPDSLLVALFVDEAGISKVKAGQRVLVELNTQRNTILEARVTKVYPYFDRETQSFKVEARFATPPAVPIAGTLLQANIIVDRKESALLIPRSCLRADGQVRVKVDGKSTQTAITTGIVSTEWVEVLGGIGKDAQVLKAF